MIDTKHHSTYDVAESSTLDSILETENITTSFLQFDTVEKAINSAKIVTRKSNLSSYSDLIEKGAILANFPNEYNNQKFFTTGEQAQIESERKHPWNQNWTLYFLAATSAMSAAVQGMDESAVGGASLFYIKHFKINGDSVYDANIQGIVNSIPYLAAAVVGCWIAIPSNEYYGRRVTIFWASFLAAISGLWQAFSPTWQMLLVGRLIMGISIGAKSATVPVYTAESTPAAIRGGLVMLWQTLTAFGVMWGFVMGVAFLNSGKDNWRFMLGSVFPLPLVVCALIFWVPESPRWLIKKGRFEEAFNSFQRLRTSDLIAARDFYYTFILIEKEQNAQQNNTWYLQYVQLFTLPRNRSATLASWILMFGQQFCGVNILTFYISNVLTKAGFSDRDALSGSCGFGALAVCGAITAIPLIDKKGRRRLVLFTLPLLIIFLLWVGFSFYGNTEKERLGLVLTGIYLYVYFYGIGMGPIPFTYNAEVASITVRDAHSSFGTATTWLFSFILGFTFPNLLNSIGSTGVFSFYAGWCFLLLVLVFFFVPETKGFTLEELDLIFSLPILYHAKYQLNELKNVRGNLFFKRKSSTSIIKLALDYQANRSKV